MRPDRKRRLFAGIEGDGVNMESGLSLLAGILLLSRLPAGVRAIAASGAAHLAQVPEP
ncbi:MAG: hypothetical protein WCJ69_12090 [Betaproteobacteria bacterium]